MKDFSILFGFGLPLALAFGYAGLARNWSGWWTRALVVGCAVGVPAFLVLTLMSGTGRLGDIRVALTAVEVGVPASGLTIGGDPAADSIVVAPRRPGDPGMHAAAVAVVPGSSGLQLTFQRPGPDGPAGVVRIGSPPSGPFQTDARVHLDSHRVGASDVVCFPSPDDPQAGAVPVSFSATDRLLRARGRPGAWAPGNDQRYYQFRDYLIWGADDLASADGRGLPRGRFAHLRSLFQRTGDSVQVLLLDPGAWVARDRLDCGDPPALVPAQVALDANGDKGLTFQAVVPPSPSESRDLFDASQDQTGARTDLRPAARLVTRRSAVLDAIQAEDGGWRLRVAFDTPEIAVLEAQDLGAAMAPIRDRITLTFAGLEEGEVASDLAAIRLRSLGEPVIADLIERIELTNGSDVYQIGGRANAETPHRIGETIKVGGQSIAEIRIQRIDWSWPNLWGVFVLSVAAMGVSAAGTWRWRMGSRAAFVILTLADFVLAMRILVGVQGAVIATGAGAPMAPHAALAAAVVVPWLLASWAPQALRASIWAWALQGVFVLVACAALISFGVLTWDSLHWLAVGALALLAGLGRWGPDILSCLDRRFPSLAKATGTALDTIRARPMLWLLVLFVVCLARLISPAELLGANVAAVYTIVVVAIWAALLDAAARPKATETGRQRILSFLGRTLLLIACIAPLFAAYWSDNGYAIVMILSLTLTLSVFAAWPPIGEGIKLNRFMLLAPVLALAVLVGGSGVLTSFHQSGPWPDRSEQDAAANERRIDLIEQALDRERYVDRVTQFASPDALTQQGTDQAEGLRSQAYAWRQFASQGLSGRGYLNLPEPGDLRLYQFSDNLPAVHLLAPFGSLGTAAFLLVLAMAALAVTLIVRQTAPGRWPPWRQSIGLVALWTLFAGSLYMILANLDLMPFTGRNVLMLSAYSPSDLVEAALLILVAVVATAREAET